MQILLLFFGPSYFVSSIILW